jgi:transcriptional regulator with XRE-family HTH domain
MGTIQQFDELKTRKGNRGMKFKDVLRDLRKQAGMTQEELAKKAGVPLPSLRGHEQGQRIPSWASVVKLAKALSVSTDAFSDCDEVQEEEKPAPTRKIKGKEK